MRFRFTCLLFIGLSLSLLSAQSSLKPFIGVDSLPDPTTPICPIPLYLGSFDDSGLFAGDTVPDFQLFSPDGSAFHLEEALALGKPVLLVNGSYTCPVFRGKVPALNQLVATYGNQVTICVIYTVEAHPDIDISPYFGFVNTGAPNINAGILYRQPLTYGERLAVVEDMLANMAINAPVYVDGPCNNWWSVFGPAPNNAYLISQEGIVIAKHGWFNRTPNDMSCDIENFLNNNMDCGNTGGGAGTFDFRFLSDTIVYGQPGDGLYVESRLENTSANPVNIEIRRMIENVPGDWTTAMCIDICYATSVDYTTIQIPPGETQLFIMDFFTDSSTIGQGMVQIGFRNLDNLNNKFTRRMYASTESINVSASAPMQNFSTLVYPQPAHDVARIAVPEAWWAGHATSNFQLFDLQGKLVMEKALRQQILEVERGGLPSGVYLFTLTGTGNSRAYGKLIFD